MVDMIPWLDETYIIEAGRLFLCGGDCESILMNKADAILLPLYYVGPCIQECCFRFFGLFGARISPLLGLIAIWFCFRSWLKQTKALPSFELELVALLVLTAPLSFQSAILTRVDVWAIASTFAALAILGPPGTKRSRPRLFAGAFFAVLTPFIWPTAIVSFFLFVPVCFRRTDRREILRFILSSCLAGIIISIPILVRLPAFIQAFKYHFEYATGPGQSSEILMPLAKEIARSPFIALISLIGLSAWIRDRKWSMITAFLLSLAICVKTSLYAFRIIHLTPYILLMCIDGIVLVRSYRESLTKPLLILGVVYGIVSGPAAIPFLGYPTLPRELKDRLATVVGTGSVRVFAPDHATYYIGRELGWKQFGLAKPSESSDPVILKKILPRVDAVVLRDFDAYTPFQQSWTFYGLFCKYVLAAAKNEASLPPEKKSWAAKFGSQFSFSWHSPIVLDEFIEVEKIGMIHVFKRRSQQQD